MEALQYLVEWVKSTTDATEDPVKFVSGGPGSGKSSLSTMTLVEASRIKAIFPILIRLLDFKWDGAGLEAALDRYIQTFCPHLPSSPWLPDALKYFGGRSIVIFFDGLDELSKALGAHGENQSRAISESIIEFIRQKNIEGAKTGVTLKAVVLGRTVAIQEINRSRLERNDKREIILLSMDPDPIQHHDRLRGLPVDDPNKLLPRDDRKQWWSNYVLATRESGPIPVAYLGDALLDLTREPLTLFLLAYTGYHKNTNTDHIASMEIAQIYRNILYGVYKRDLERGAHAGQAELLFQEFFRALQVIGFAAWFSTERSTTRSGLTKTISDMIPFDRGIFERFEKSMAEGAMKMLLAAHMRVKDDGDQKDEAAYEFSHKTFGEFLAAECLWRLIRNTAEPFLEMKISIDMTIERITEILGQAQMTPDFVKLLQSVMRLPNSESIRCGITDKDIADDEEGRRHFMRSFEEKFCRPLIGHCKVYGAPVHKKFGNLSFNKMVATEMSVVRSVDDLRSAALFALPQDVRNLIRVPSTDMLVRRYSPYGWRYAVRLNPLMCLEFSGSGGSDDLFGRAVRESSMSKLSELICSHCSFDFVTLSNCNMTFSHVDSTKFEKCSFKDISFGAPSDQSIEVREGRVKWNKVFFSNCEFENVGIEAGTMSEVVFLNCTFKNVSFKNIEFPRDQVHICGAGWKLISCAVLSESVSRKKSKASRAAVVNPEFAETLARQINARFFGSVAAT